MNDPKRWMSIFGGIRDRSMKGSGRPPIRVPAARGPAVKDKPIERILESPENLYKRSLELADLLTTVPMSLGQAVLESHRLESEFRRRLDGPPDSK